jgi:superfamily II DNA or RNA helicase
VTVTLYPYQETAIVETESWLCEDPAHMRGMLVLPTGAGKTITFSEMCRRLLAIYRDKRIVILVHTDELARQTVKALRAVAPDLIVGVVKARENEVTADVIVASVQTLRNPARMSQIRDVIRVIVDECDLAAAPSYRRILEHFGCFKTGPVKAVGVTATPYRSDGNINTVWQEITYAIPLTWMIRKKFLIPPRGIAVTVPDLNLAAVKSTKADYKDGELGEALADSLAPELVAQAIVEHASDRKILAFFPTVASSYVFAEAIEAAGIPAEVIHGGLSQDERDGILARHKRGTVVVNCMILTVGYDDPEVDCIVLGRPTKSKRLYVQIVGRGLRVDKSRPYEEQDCLLLDVVGANVIHDLRTMADLSEKALDPEKAKSGRTLTELEDEFDAGEGVEEDTPQWYVGETVVKEFDPLGGKTMRSKVWIRTDGGTHFIPAGTNAYVFVMEYPEPGKWSVSYCSKDVRTPVYVCDTHGEAGVPQSLRRGPCCKAKHVGLTSHAGLDADAAMTAAEDLAVDMGADTMNLANRKAKWRSGAPSDKMKGLAMRLGAPWDGTENAGKLSDRISRIEATRRIDPLVRKAMGGKA